jgi:hypothetical protein
MRQLKSSFGFWSTPPATATGNDGYTQGPGNPSPEEVERRTLPTQDNQFPHQTSAHTDDEALKLAVGDPL